MLGIWLWLILIFTICTVTIGGWPFFFIMLVLIPVLGFLGGLIQTGFLADVFSNKKRKHKKKTPEEIQQQFAKQSKRLQSIIDELSAQTLKPEIEEMIKVLVQYQLAFQQQKKKIRDKGLYEYILAACAKTIETEEDNLSVRKANEGVTHIIQQLGFGTDYRNICANLILHGDAFGQKKEKNPTVTDNVVVARTSYGNPREQLNAILAIVNALDKDLRGIYVCKVLTRLINLGNLYFTKKAFQTDLYNFVIETSEKKIATLKTRSVINEYKFMIRIVEELQKGRSPRKLADNLYLYGDAREPENEADRKKMPTLEEKRSLRGNSNVQQERLNIFMRYITPLKVTTEVNRLVFYVLDLQGNYYKKDENSRFLLFEYMVNTAIAQRDRTSKEDLRRKYDMAARLITALWNDKNPLEIGSNLMKFGDIDAPKEKNE